MYLRWLLTAVMVTASLGTPATASAQILISNPAALALRLDDLSATFDIFGEDTIPFEGGIVPRTDYVVVYEQVEGRQSVGPQIIEVRLVKFGAPAPREAFDSVLVEYLTPADTLSLIPIEGPGGSGRWSRLVDANEPGMVGYAGLFELTDGLASIAAFGPSNNMLLQDVTVLADTMISRLLA